MRLTTRLLKIELLRAGLSNAAIAAEAGVHPSLVSHVLAGRRLAGRHAQQVQRTIADKLGVAVDELFAAKVA